MPTRTLIPAVLCVLLAASTIFAQTLPPTPTNLTATLIAPSPNAMPGVLLTWQAPSGPWGFKIYRSAMDTLHYAMIGVAQPTAREFRDMGVLPGIRYFYYVTSFTTMPPPVESPRSNVATILVPGPLPRRVGFIAGTVVDDSTLRPIPRVRMQFFRIAAITLLPPVVFTDSLGRYHAVLDTGRYIVKAQPLCTTTYPCYIPEFFDNCREPSCATVIAVRESTTFTANFGLTRLTPPTFATLSGVVVDSLTRQPLARASVAIMRTMQEMAAIAATGEIPGLGEERQILDGVGYTEGVVWRGYTDNLGRYSARLIAGQSYLALASKEGYFHEYYRNKRNPQEADIITLRGDTTGIDFDLVLNPLLQNSIAGIVRDSLGIRVPSRIVLYPLRPTPSPSLVGYRHTDSLGAYLIRNVPAGRYFVQALPYSRYAPAFYKANAYGVRRWQDADTVNVVGNVTGINIGVVRINSNGFARITGTAEQQRGMPLPGVNVTATAPDGTVLGIGLTDNTGGYEINAVVSGTVIVGAGKQHYASSDQAIGVPPFASTIPNINFTMMPEAVTAAGTGTIPAEFTLEQNFPNPFNPSTEIRYSVPSGRDLVRGADGQTSEISHVTLKVYDLLGREVATLVNEVKQAGTYTVQWNAGDAASGVYVYRLEAGNRTLSRKAVVVK